MAELVDMDRSIPGFLIRCVQEPTLHLKVIVRQPLGWETYERSLAESTFENMIHPTAVVYREAYWRVYSLREGPDGWAYVLDPWPDGEALRRTVHLDAESLRRDAEEQRRFRNSQSLAQMSGWYSWLFGLLAARVQNELDERFEFDPVSATARSGMIEFQLGFMLAAVSVIAMIGMKSMGALMMAMVAVWMTVEGIIRWTGASNGDRACGLFVLELVDLVWVAISGKR